MEIGFLFMSPKLLADPSKQRIPGRTLPSHFYKHKYCLRLVAQYGSAIIVFF
jgi:hypothetical protein